MRFGFVTCVELGLSCMEAIYDIGGTLDLVATLQDDMAVGKSGRVYVDKFCEKHEIELIKIRHVNDEVAEAKFKNLDWLFIIGWSQIADARVIGAPRMGVLGIHPTLLPIGRGRAAIPWAILKELDKTGVTMFKLDEGVDTGPLLAQLEIPLTEDTDAGALYRMVDSAHIRLIKDVYPNLVAKKVVLREQNNSLATVWPGRTPDDGQINLGGSVYNAERMVRAVTRPYPGAFYRDSSGRKIIIWAAKISHSKPKGDFLQFSDGYLSIIENEIVFD